MIAVCLYVALRWTSNYPGFNPPFPKTAGYRFWQLQRPWVQKKRWIENIRVEKHLLNPICEQTVTDGCSMLGTKLLGFTTPLKSIITCMCLIVLYVCCRLPQFWEMSVFFPEWFSPPCKAWDVIIAVVHFQIICEARRVIFDVKLQKLKADLLAQAHADVPGADLFVLILFREPRRLNDLFFICQNPTAFFGWRKKKTMEKKYNKCRGINKC